MAIIMATTMDTTEDPDTESAGTLLKLFSNIVVFIFNPVKEKTSLWLITAERSELFDFKLHSTTATSRTAADNHDCSHNNNADNVVEKSIHLVLVSHQNAHLIYHRFPFFQG